MVLLRTTFVGYKETDDDEVVLLIAGRGEDGNRYSYEVTGVEPWGYVPEDMTVENEEGVEYVEHGYESFDGVPLKRFVTRTPGTVGSIAEEADETTYETDIPFDRKCSIFDGFSGYIEAPEHKSRIRVGDINTDPDIDASKEIEPRVMVADIEAKMGDETFSEMKEGATQPIIMIATHDPYEDEYNVFFYDEDGDYDASKIPGHMEDHWEDEELYERYWENPSINVHRCENEAHLLTEFRDYISEVRPDLISGWNWIDFDHEYIIDRFEEKDISLRKFSDFGKVDQWRGHRAIYGLPGFDMMVAYCDKMEKTGLRSRALDYVAETKLGIGKVDNININYAWENDIERLISYNLIDVQLCVELDRKEGIHEFFYELGELAGIHIYDMFTKHNEFAEMRVVDGAIMTRRDDDEVLPRQKMKEIEENAGGWVKEASSGIQESLSVFDLKSLYPSVIITWNISTETFTWDTDEADLIVPWTPEPKEVKGKIESDHISMDKFGTKIEKEGVIPKYLRRLFVVRDELKEERDKHGKGSYNYDVFDRKQCGIKVIMNSFYGVSSNPWWRLAKEGMGDAITSAARYTLWRGVEISEEMGYDVRYSDTDSIFLDLGIDGDLEDTLEAGYELEEEINNQMDVVADEIGVGEKHPFISGTDIHGTDRQCLVFEYEKYYESFIQLGQKKRYAGLISWKEGKKLDDPDIDVTGFESKRSDSPEITEEVQEEVLKRILHSGDFKDISEYIQEKKDELEGNPHRFAMPASINKALEDYPNREKPRACKYSNRYLDKDFGPGDEAFVYYVDKVPSDVDNTDVVAIEWNEDLPDGFTLHKSKMVRKALKLPLEDIIGEMGWTWTQVETGKKPDSLDTSDEVNFGPGSSGSSTETDKSASGISSL